ncbi:MAG: sensor domain-containing diguanylate cyclase [Oleibacter sp.]|nr:sensor domain-containing diguanylate cyclase [Thalassolituus sp.]
MRYFVTLLFLWMLSTASFALEVIDLERISENLPIGQYVESVRLQRTNDASNDVVLSDEVRNGDFTPGKHDALNFGYTQKRIWLRFEVNNASDQDIERILNVRYPLLDTLRLYNDKSTTPIYTLGRMLAGRNNQAMVVPAPYFIMPLVIKAHSSETYYLSIESDDSIAVPIFLTTLSNLENTAFKYSVGFALYFGLTIANILFAVFMTLLLRERAHLFYSLFVISNSLLFFFVLEGFPNTIFGIDSLFFNRDIIAYIVSTSIAIFSVFGASYLRLKTLAPKAYRLSQVLTGIMLVSLILCFILPYFYAITLSTFAAVLVGTFYGFVAINYLRLGHPGVKSYLLAWGVGVTGSLIYGMKVWNLVPVNLFTSYGWHIGSLFEIAVFSLMMAYRAAQDRKERLDALEQLNKKERDLRQTQEHFLETQIKAKAELELQVKQRTRDLSNILGQLEHENKSLVELSINDALTKIPNRRYFNDIYPQMWSDAIDAQTPISVIMLDVDHFKRINDDYGHLSGDYCLVKLANIMRETVRHPRGVLCRYGGEEFVIALSDTTQEEAYVIAESIRKKIASMIISNDGKTFRVTSSFGIASLVPTSYIAPESLLAKSDAALYQSKNNGRNQVSLANEENCLQTALPQI